MAIDVEDLHVQLYYSVHIACVLWCELPIRVAGPRRRMARAICDKSHVTREKASAARRAASSDRFSTFTLLYDRARAPSLSQARLQRRQHSPAPTRAHPRTLALAHPHARDVHEKVRAVMQMTSQNRVENLPAIPNPDTCQPIHATRLEVGTRKFQLRTRLGEAVTHLRGMLAWVHVRHAPDIS